MAKKLSNLRRNVDDLKTGKEIRCLIVENFNTGLLSIVRDRKMFSNILEKVDSDYVTKVYNPTQEEKVELLTLIEKNSVVIDGHRHVKIPEEEVFIEMLRFTDIEKSDNHEENIESIKNPGDLLIMVRGELNKILYQIYTDYQEIQRTINDLPEDVLKGLLEADDARKQLEDKIKEEEQRKLERERKEKEKAERRKKLEEEMAALDAEDEE